ncbi:UNVERIFIED_CONTAM: protein MAINTENANCE OF MERISTEMS [Sesamum radiatum]|uniref:Protein MAINTENANCE OF MERISTEMS n=1 Tax=Sesamum radiatum TaxID=300843 RepID=A0AAW2RW26_SESRA
MNRRAVYGPRDGTVLSQQTQHRSDDILDGDLDDVLKARRADGVFWSHFQQHNLLDYCLTYLGFRPAATAFKGSRLQTHAIISHIAQVEITYDTLHEIVVQYARAVALLLLGGVMCPDSSGNLIPLLYLTKLEDIVEARNYSWGSAVLAFLYRELCNATNKGKATIGGALQLLQFIWQPYDLDSDVIMAYAADFNPQLWRSSCPLIFYAIVEMHHPERVLRQFGMRQNIPEATDTRDMSLHQISRKNVRAQIGTCNTYNTSVDGREDMTRLYKGRPSRTEEIQNEDIGNGTTT